MISGSLHSTGQITGTLTGVANVSGNITIPRDISTQPFTGAYEYTPTQATQTIQIEGLRALHDIVINPIPSNYGLVEWNGIALSIS